MAYELDENFHHTKISCYTVIAPIEDNCSPSESDEDVAIVCIRFVWKFTEVFGVAGGLVTLSLLLCKLHMAVLIDSQTAVGQPAVQCSSA